MSKLETTAALSAPELLAPPVFDALQGWASAGSVLVAPIDAAMADTAEFCAADDVGLDESANCVVIAGKRDGELRYATCLGLATTRADVNGVGRKRPHGRQGRLGPGEAAARRGPRRSSRRPDPRSGCRRRRGWSAPPVGSRRRAPRCPAG